MIISLSGKIGSGKDLVCKIIHYHIAHHKNPDLYPKSLEEWPDNLHELEQRSGFQTKTFADKLKEAASILLGCTRSKLDDMDFKESPLDNSWSVTPEMFNGKYKRDGTMTPRLFLQLLGTDCGRNIIHPNIWINALFTDYNKENSEYPDWIVTDSRFKNDDNILKEKGALRIRINRPNNNDSSDHAMHESETDLDDVTDFDAIIENDSGIPELIDKVKVALVHLDIIT